MVFYLNVFLAYIDVDKINMKKNIPAAHGNRS